MHQETKISCDLALLHYSLYCIGLEKNLSISEVCQYSFFFSQKYRFYLFIYLLLFPNTIFFLLYSIVTHLHIHVWIFFLYKSFASIIYHLILCEFC